MVVIGNVVSLLRIDLSSIGIEFFLIGVERVVVVVAVDVDADVVVVVVVVVVAVVVVVVVVVIVVVVVVVVVVFFSSRRRHTRFLYVSWARRCV